MPSCISGGFSPLGGYRTWTPLRNLLPLPPSTPSYPSFPYLSYLSFPLSFSLSFLCSLLFPTFLLCGISKCWFPKRNLCSPFEVLLVFPPLTVGDPSSLTSYLLLCLSFDAYLILPLIKGANMMIWLTLRAQHQESGTGGEMWQHYRVPDNLAPLA